MAVEQVLAFDLGEHLLNVGGRVSSPGGLANDRQFLARVGDRLVSPGFPECLTHPFGDGHAMPLGDAADFGDLIVLEEDLEAGSHSMSINDSSR